MEQNHVNNNDEISKMFGESSDRTASFNNVGKLQNPAFTFGSRENFGTDNPDDPDEPDTSAKPAKPKKAKPEKSKKAKAIKSETPVAESSEPVIGSHEGFGFAKERYHKTVRARSAVVAAIIMFLLGAALGGGGVYYYLEFM
jgi:hypothetical protein